MRIFKTLGAVLLVCAAYGLLGGRNPCFACIGAVFGLGSFWREGVRHGGNRFLGTLLGGLVVIPFYWLYANRPFGLPGHLYLVLGLFCVIYINLLFGAHSAIQPAAVVYFVVMFTVTKDRYVSYTIARILGTGVGVLAGLAINRLFPAPRDARDTEDAEAMREDASSHARRAKKTHPAPRDAYLQAAVAYGWGMRILRQDLWEVIVSFIVSQNNNIPRIRKNLRDLCAMQGGAFPTPVALAAAQPETLRALGLGYRAEYLCAAGAHFAQADALDALRAMSYPEAHTALRAVKGVGPKVADCICLFGLHHVDAFPVDTHVKQILSAHYPKGFPFRRYAGCAGILQQYMFYYDLHGSAQAAP